MKHALETHPYKMTRGRGRDRRLTGVFSVGGLHLSPQIGNGTGRSAWS